VVLVLQPEEPCPGYPNSHELSRICDPGDGAELPQESSYLADVVREGCKLGINDQVRADEIDRQSAAVARDREILLWREKITEHEIAAEAARQGGYGLSQNLVVPEDLEI